MFESDFRKHSLIKVIFLIKYLLGASPRITKLVGLQEQSLQKSPFYVFAKHHKKHFKSSFKFFKITPKHINAINRHLLHNILHLAYQSVGIFCKNFISSLK